jgi:hypothetical protein
VAAAAPAATVPPSTEAAVAQGTDVNRVTAASARTTAARSSTSRVVHSPGSSTRRDNPSRVEPAAMARTSGARVRTEATSAAYPAATSSGQPSKPVQNAARVSASMPWLTPFAASSTQVSTPMPVTAYDASRSRSRSSRPRPTSTGTAIASRSPPSPDVLQPCTAVTRRTPATSVHSAATQRVIRVLWAHSATPAPSATRSPPASVNADRVESWSSPNRPEA